MATTSEPNKRQKRRLRPATQTVREKAATAKVEASKDKGAYRSAFWSGFTWPFRKIGRFFAWLGKFRVFRWLASILLLRYFVNSWRELRQVSWPTRRQSWQLTSAVLIFAAVFGAIVAAVDFGLDKLFKEIVLR